MKKQTHRRPVKQLWIYDTTHGRLMRRARREGRKSYVLASELLDKGLMPEK